MGAHILLVEDEAAISEPLQFLLEREGYVTRVVANGLDVLDEFARAATDLVLLDLMLPGQPGTEVCRQLRAKSTVPIVMLTAKDAEIDIVMGLELGADDYVTKPYSSQELLARIRAVLRRHGEVHGESHEPLTIGRVTLNVDKHIVTVDDQETPMPLKEFELLELLMRNAGSVMTRGQLIDRVWGSNYVGDTKTLDVHIKRLRSRIEPDPSSPRTLVTVRGVGYRLEVDAAK